MIYAGNESQMDKIDLTILEALQNNARISNVE
ncbi:AsnC family protein, partial [uncultured Candidatus Puniceispirillum sp.]